MAGHIEYPQNLNKKEKTAFKRKLLRERPETLYADLKNITEVSNLIFFTDQLLAWHAAIRAHYPSVEEKEIQDARQFKFKEVEDSDTVMTTVNVFYTGTVEVQGNFQPFERDFPRIKERAQQERIAPTDNNQTLPETDTTPTDNDHTLPETDTPPTDNDQTLPETDTPPTDNTQTLPETDTPPTDNNQTLTDVFAELSLNPPTPPTRQA